MKKANKYKRFISKIKSMTRSRKIPRSFSKRNNNVFSNTSYIVMSTLMIKEDMSYRELIDFVDLLKEEIGLRRLPHFTTINKFILRIKPRWFDCLIEETIKSIEIEEVICSIDGTGFSLNSRSKYYETIAGVRREFLQLNSCCENRHKMFVSWKIHRKRVHENKDFKQLARKADEQLKISHFLADKAYDSEENHRFVRYELGCEFVAPLRRHGKKIKGFYRKQMEKLPSIYNKRASISENGHSIIKNKYGDVIYGKKFRTQKNELLIKILVYNIEKVIDIVHLRLLLSTAL